VTDGLQWREYTIQIPVGMASILDRALDDQVALENRAIDQSEFLCWVIGLGLAARAQLVKEHKRSERRIIDPTNPHA
jgi:hypothetical protein